MLEVAPPGSDTRCFAERRLSACETADSAYVMCFLSVRLQCEDCYFTVYVVTWPTGPSPMIGEAKISACYSTIKNTP